MVLTPSLPMGASAAPRVIFTPEQTTAAIVDLSNGMAEMRLTMQSILQYLHPPMPTYAAPPQPSLPFSQQMLPISYPYGMPTDASPSSSTSTPLPSTNAPIPIHQPWMPPSPSPIPSYAMASTMGPVYTMASTTAATTTVAPAPTTGAVVLSGGPSLQHPFTDGIFYRGASVQQI